LIRDWTQQNKTWFCRRRELEKRMMFIILTLIVAVAVSTWSAPW
jgi:ABC-type lipoprotein release transport system permease subunit